MQLGHTVGVRILLAYNPEVDARAADGRSALAGAAVDGYDEMVAKLIGHGAKLDTFGRDGNTPLMLAARGGHTRAVAAVLYGGPDVNARNPVNGNTALMLAANSGVLSAVRLLLAAGADANARANDGWTALEAAGMIGADEIAAALRRAGAQE